MEFLPKDLNGSDDIFANSSTETVVESVDFSFVLQQAYMQTHFSNATGKTNTKGIGDNDVAEVIDISPPDAFKNDNSIADCLVSKVSSFPKLYCPFCCSNFTSQTMMKGHMRDKHLDHLENMTVGGLDAYLRHACQFCHARYCTTDLLISHITLVHPDNMLAMFQENRADMYVECGFCPYKTLFETKEEFLAHVQRNHFLEFRNLIEQKSTEVLKAPQFSPVGTDNSSISVLSNLLMQMSTKDNEEPSNEKPLNSSLKKVSGDRIRGSKSVRFQLNGHSTKRKLSFSPEEKENIKTTNKENIISCSSNIRQLSRNTTKPAKVQPQPKWKSVFSFKNKENPRIKGVKSFVTSTPNTHTFKTTRIERVKPEMPIMKGKQKLPVVKEKQATEAVKSKLPLTNKNAISAETRKSKPPKNKPEVTVVEKKDLASEPVTELKSSPPVPWTPPEESFKQYKCAICQEAFANNTDLLSHARLQHTGPMKLLHPPYKCGQCDAKFYKNSFLVKHCRFHHTPRCLKNKLPS